MQLLHTQAIQAGFWKTIFCQKYFEKKNLSKIFFCHLYIFLQFFFRSNAWNSLVITYPSSPWPKLLLLLLRVSGGRKFYTPPPATVPSWNTPDPVPCRGNGFWFRLQNFLRTLCYFFLQSIPMYVSLLVFHPRKILMYKYTLCFSILNN